jgi:hypothetical protein
MLSEKPQPQLIQYFPSRAGPGSGGRAGPSAAVECRNLASIYRPIDGRRFGRAILAPDKPSYSRPVRARSGPFAIGGIPLSCKHSGHGEFSHRPSAVETRGFRRSSTSNLTQSLVPQQTAGKTLESAGEGRLFTA